FIIYYLNDILIFSKTIDKYQKYIKNSTRYTIFNLFYKKNIIILPTKLYIGYLNVELLSFCIDSPGLTNID
ncbi:hypothetical protein MYCTH_2053156, partial [Thermothelomyces thermophilus ATCC 42464]